MLDFIKNIKRKNNDFCTKTLIISHYLKILLEIKRKFRISMALHDNVLEVLKASFTPREIRMRLREVEYDEKEAEIVFPL